jgi:hypothetical protein
MSLELEWRLRDERRAQAVSKQSHFIKNSNSKDFIFFNSLFFMIFFVLFWELDLWELVLKIDYSQMNENQVPW